MGRYRCTLGMGVCLCVAGFVAPTASANTIAVRNTNDSGPGSLRQAISDASGGDTISVPGGLYKLNSVLSVNKALTFVGAGARTATVDGQNTTQLFNVTPPAASVTISGLTLRNGKATGNGGAIDSAVPLTLTDDAITGSTASSGGGVAVSSALTMDRDLVAGNTSSGFGGGIEYEPPNAVSSTISDTTVTQNSAVNDGGGINELNTSTETLQLFNDSLIANTASDTSSQGGDFRAWSGTTLEYANTVIAQGSASVEPNCAFGGGATVTSLGHNAQDMNDTNCNMTGPGDMTNTNPMLSILRDNGGPTETLLPAVDSPLLDAASATYCTAQDQRGVSRPQGTGCDIGAVERTTPSVGRPVVSAITPTSATVTTTVNPVYIGGTFIYNYGPTSSYGSSRTPKDLIAGQANQPASTRLDGLAPSTTYHVQVVITTADGAAQSGDISFRTQAQPPPITTPAPALSGARLTNARFRVGNRATAVSARKRRVHLGTTFEFSLSTTANVRIAITRKMPGRRTGRRCVLATKKLIRRHAKACTLTVPAGTLSRRNQPTGSDHIAFTGRIGRRALKPGKYNAALQASNASGQSKVTVLHFVIVK